MEVTKSENLFTTHTWASFLY